jgi:hypothetical protein
MSHFLISSTLVAQDPKVTPLLFTYVLEGSIVM